MVAKRHLKRNFASQCHIQLTSVVKKANCSVKYSIWRLATLRADIERSFVVKALNIGGSTKRMKTYTSTWKRHKKQMSLEPRPVKITTYRRW